MQRGQRRVANADWGEGYRPHAGIRNVHDGAQLSPVEGRGWLQAVSA